VLFHVIALHITGSNNPTGVEPKDTRDTISFAPYMTQKDLFASVVFLTIFAFMLFFLPNALGHPDNYIKADPLVTPAHIVPEWYFLPFYAILRAIPDKLFGVLAMGGAIISFAALPWLDKSPIRSCRYRPFWKWCVWLFVIDFFALMYCGAMPAEQPYVIISQFGTAYWFGFLFILAPLVGLYESPKNLPSSIHKSLK
jgi:ubiquinol-cytochrome c reductase cytochrome b subunit